MYSGILIHNTSHSIISNNIVIDDREAKSMKSAIEETGDSDYNIINNNRLNKGMSGSIDSKGMNTRKENNLIH